MQAVGGRRQLVQLLIGYLVFLLTLIKILINCRGNGYDV